MSGPVIAEHDVTVHLGHVADVLPTLPAGSVQCCVTSPPYYGLRDYGVDGQLGLEASPAEYVAAMVAVFAEVRRVLADDGVLWLNLGSSYANGSTPGPQGATGQRATRAFTAEGLGYAAAAARLGAPSRDTPYTQQSGSPGPDCACSDLCDECAAARSSRSSGTAQPRPVSRPRDVQTVRDRSRPGYGSASPAASPLDVPVSTTLRSSPRPPASCLHCDNCGACLSVLRSSGRDARACERREEYTDGTSRTRSDVHSRGTDAFGEAWLNYTRALGPKSLIPIPWMVAMSLQTDGWILRNAVIWSKPNAMPESVTDRLSTRYEHVFLFSKSRRYTFDLDPIREPAGEYVGKSWVERKALGSIGGSNRGVNTTANPVDTVLAAHPNGRNPGDLWKINEVSLEMPAGALTRDDAGDVWEIATTPFPGAHFATMPPELARRCILAGSREGTTVLDPFAGSGTTLKAARSLGRNSVGVELNPAYIDIIRERIGQQTLDFGASA